MRAMRLHAFGEALRLDEITPPEPGPGAVRIRVEACGVNFADMLMVAGTYQDTPEPPFAPGLETAGVIDALGPGAEARFAVGDRVAALTPGGGFAEQAIARVEACAALPEGFSADEAAALPVAYGTSLVALDEKARLAPGERLLVLGAAGGVGLTAVEIGKLLGAEVIACARGGAKLEAAKAAGADHLLDVEGVEDVAAFLRAEVKALGGADVVYDPVGGDHWEGAFRAANGGARLLPIGFAGGAVPQIPANIVMVKNLTIIGFYWGGWLKRRPEAFGAALARLVAWRAEGRIAPRISDRFALADAQKALSLLKERKAVGKVVIAP